ncbi:VC0807 family protein [Peribacillus sp. SCS-26]|uniref:VC0807 family protein n=1 Tax=Paraperibacillus marinus TaxID=3115295 RepID=UPI003905D341
MKKNILILDLIFYVAVPLLVWNGGRGVLGDYYAMLLSSVPGIIYSLYRFFEVKKVNFFGLFILINLVIGTLIDVLAGSAIQLLWNNAYYLFVLGGVFLISIFINKPIALLFTLDVVELQGSDREKTKELFYRKKPLLVFKWITLAFAMRDIVLGVVKIYLIKEYGVDAFDKGILLRQAFSWGVTLLTVFGYYYITKIMAENSTDKKDGSNPIL